MMPYGPFVRKKPERTDSLSPRWNFFWQTHLQLFAFISDHLMLKALSAIEC